MQIIVMVLPFVGVAAGMLVIWLLLWPWFTNVEREVAEEQAMLKVWEEELPILKRILEADDSEYEGMSLTETIRVTLEKMLREAKV